MGSTPIAHRAHFLSPGFLRKLAALSASPPHGGFCTASLPLKATFETFKETNAE
jgi:hypothetical protein